MTKQLGNLVKAITVYISFEIYGYLLYHHMPTKSHPAFSLNTYQEKYVYMLNMLRIIPNNVRA